MDWRVALDKGAADKQCLGEKTPIPNRGRWSPLSLCRHIHLGEGILITNREEGKGKPPRLFPKIGYPCKGYPEPALQQKTGERENIWEF